MSILLCSSDHSQNGQGRDGIPLFAFSVHNDCMEIVGSRLFSSITLAKHENGDYTTPYEVCLVFFLSPEQAQYSPS